jgi:hypothetical protein
MNSTKSEENKKPFCTRSEERVTVTNFWNTHKPTISTIKSIDKVYDLYKKDLQHINIQNNTQIQPLNKYIFRTQIRKLGYNNS